MTKVRTILAEFCSAKDILAINRLGLLKKEERESQPIPWRHRLPNAERRALVRSELRMAVRPKTYQTRRDKDRAISSAKYPYGSKMGECLLNASVKQSTILEPKLGRLSSEQHRTQCRLQHQKKTFLKSSQCLNHEPLILVERPASPKVKSRAVFMKKHGVDPDVIKVPRYMRPTKCKSRTPSVLTTIEAFTLHSKKKQNLWEQAMDQKESPKFKSIAKPSARLTEYEMSQIKLGYSLHKPTTESLASTGKLQDDDVADTTTLRSKLSSAQDKRSRHASASPFGDPPRRPKTSDSTVFVTQLAEDDDVDKSIGTRLKSVTFSDITAGAKPERKGSRGSRESGGSRESAHGQASPQPVKSEERTRKTGVDVRGIYTQNPESRIAALDANKNSKPFLSILLTQG